MGGSIPDYLDVLNDEQRQAVLHTGNPLLILAGAGAGKTRVITSKIAYLIGEKGVDPGSILAVTFTNKAAREMAERAQLLDSRSSGAMLRTFHSFGAWFLRRYGSYGGLDPGFVIYDDDDTIALLSTIMDGVPRVEVKSTANRISRAKDYFLTPDDPELGLIDQSRSFRAYYAKYEERLARIGNVDFGDLIKKTVEILRNEPVAARRIHERFRVVLVDEYQDANVAQSELLKELYSSGAYICVVGDDDQSIYRFRGAEVKNILSFPDYYKNTDIVRLERNYRSTGNILRAAASVVDHNKGRLGKNLKAERGEGKAPVLAFLQNQDMEADYCADLISKGVRAAGTPYSNWAVIYRTNAQSLGFETEFLRRKIPYRLIGSLKFYEREEVKDTLALLSFLVNPRDEVAFRRMVNKPSRGLGPATVGRIVEEAMRLNSPVNDQAGGLLQAARNIAPELSPKARQGIAAYIKAIEAGRAAIMASDSPPENIAKAKGLAPGDLDSGPPAGNPLNAQAQPGKSRKPPKAGSGLRAGVGLSVCVAALAEASGIVEYHLSHDEISGNYRINNLQEVVNAASLYAASWEGLQEFLEHIELDRSVEDVSGDAKDAVSLITLHNTKGLEFRRVIMTGIEQGVFPRDDKNNEDLEEERRLFYVGATRAMDELHLTSCAQRRMYGRTSPMVPSVFLREIQLKGLNIVGTVPYGFMGTQAGRAGLGVYGGNYPPGFSSRKPLESSDGRWALGDRLYNDDHGYGSVAEIREGEEGPVIRVVFETGYEKRFLSLYQSSHYTKIGED